MRGDFCDIHGVFAIHVGYLLGATCNTGDQRATGNWQQALGNQVFEAKQMARKKIVGYFLAVTMAAGNGQQAPGQRVLEAKQVARKKIL